MSDPSVPRTSPVENPILRSLGWTAWMLLTHFVAAMVLLAVLLAVVPRIVVIFEDLDAELPAMTVLVINLSRVVPGYWYLALPLGLAVDAALLFGLSRLPAEARWLGTLWASLVWMAALLLLGLIVVAVFLPLQGLMTQLS